MTDRPILFSGSMVRAILREIEHPGTGKTQTRRVLKPQPPTWAIHAQELDGLNIKHEWRPWELFVWTEEPDELKPLRRWPNDGSDEVHGWHGLSLRIRRGDRLWVREAWAKVGDASDDIHACPDLRVHTYFRADAADPERQRWRPSIHMPRRFSRLTLHVTDVRVQRLQDISEADAIAEGIEKDHAAGMPSVWGWHDYLRGAEISRRHFGDPRDSYRTLWSAINGPGSWDANPWVAAYSFVPRLGNIDTMPAEKRP